MKKLLNRFAKWLYVKTDEKEEKNYNFMDHLSGLKVISCSFVPKDCCYIDNGDYEKMREDMFRSTLKMEIKPKS